MIVSARYRQHPNDHRRRVVDYSNWLAAGEKLAMINFTITEQRPEGAGSENPFVVNNTSFDPETETKLIYFAGGSVNNSLVRVELDVLTSDNQRHIRFIDFIIDEGVPLG